MSEDKPSPAGAWMLALNGVKLHALYSKENKLRECDVCGEMKPDVTTFYYAPVGDTSACAKCRGDDE